jgi:hypothetical protein
MIHLSHTIATADVWGFAISYEQPQVGFRPGDAHILFFRQPIPNFQNGKNLYFSCGSLSKKIFIYIYHSFMTHHLEEQGGMDRET